MICENKEEVDKIFNVSNLLCKILKCVQVQRINAEYSFAFVYELYLTVDGSLSGLEELSDGLFYRDV